MDIHALVCKTRDQHIKCSTNQPPSMQYRDNTNKLQLVQYRPKRTDCEVRQQQNANLPPQHLLHRTGQGRMNLPPAPPQYARPLIPPPTVLKVSFP